VGEAGRLSCQISHGYSVLTGAQRSHDKSNSTYTYGQGWEEKCPSDKMPDYSQRKKLMPFVGKYVRATRIAFERNGTHAIVITEITDMKEVHVTIQEE